MLDIEAIKNRAKILGINIEIETPCKHKCLLIPASSELTLLIIPDDVVNLNEANGLGVKLKEIKCRTLKVIGGNNLRNINSLFGYLKIDVLDISELNTSNVTDMSGLFFCSSTQIVGLENLVTDNVINMAQMFAGYKGLKELKLINFNTRKVNYMANMFNSFEGRLDLSSFDTSNVVNMDTMFQGVNTDELDLSNFNTSKVTNLDSMFYRFKANSLNLSSFDTKGVGSMGWMFCGAEIRSKLDLRHFNFEKIGFAKDMFCNSNIAEVQLGKLPNIDNLIKLDMFHHCKLDKFNMDTDDYNKIKRVVIGSRHNDNM